MMVVFAVPMPASMIIALTPAKPSPADDNWWANNGGSVVPVDWRGYYNRGRCVVNRWWRDIDRRGRHDNAWNADRNADPDVSRGSA